MTLWQDWRSTYLLKVEPNFLQVDLARFFASTLRLICKPEESQDP